MSENGVIARNRSLLVFALILLALWGAGQWRQAQREKPVRHDPAPLTIFELQACEGAPVYGRMEFDKDSGWTCVIPELSPGIP